MHKNQRKLEFYRNVHGCWIVASHTRSGSGYPRIRRTGKYISIHRYMYEKYYGKIPIGILVCHRCDNKGCANPEHLFLGTYNDNNHDAIEKGRNMRGEKQNFAKLTEKKVRDIRKSNDPQKIIAKLYDISQSAVSLIKTRKNWAWLQ